MSRSYGMYVEIDGVDPDKIEAVQEAAGDKWSEFNSNWWEDKRQSEGENSRIVLCAHGDGYLRGGVAEDEFAAALAEAVWKANGRYCEVLVNATYLEELPYETYVLDEDDYGRFLEMSSRLAETKND